MKNAASMRDDRGLLDFHVREPADLNALFLAIRGRHSSNPIDKVCAIALPLQKRNTFNRSNVSFPIYDPNTALSVAWERLVSTIASAKMENEDYHYHSKKFHRTSTIQLLCLFPNPSRHHWFPSWAQVQQYPDVSVRDNDNDPVLVSGDMDYSLRIMSGRIYRGCSLELKRSPTSNAEAAYHCSMGMGSEIVELVATVPRIELNIDSQSRYILVDISPDRSLWPPRALDKCRWDLEGHVHPPIWGRSVIIVCKEVDNLAHAQPVQVTTHAPAILRYRLRRITTLEWDCRPPRQGDKCWLPFKPFLEHMRSVVCSAVGSKDELRCATSLCPPDVFCNPTAVAGLPVTNGWREWDKCPVYEVYLV